MKGHVKSGVVYLTLSVSIGQKLDKFFCDFQLSGGYKSVNKNSFEMKLQVDN